MKNRLPILFILFLLSGCTISTPETTENPAAIPVSKGDAWINFHREIVAKLKPDAELILIGNSIFQGLNNEGCMEIWEKYLNQYHAGNLGISGDRTENVIWRMQNGALDNIHPKVALILIGTNNTDGNHYLRISSAEELEGAIWRICEIIKEKLPDTKILLMGILPYGYTENHRNNINKATNALISKFPDRDPDIHYIDIGALYLDADGKVKRELMPDFLHPNPEGYRIMFEALEEKIAGLMGDRKATGS
jgi:beta-glucosidase